MKRKETDRERENKEYINHNTLYMYSIVVIHTVTMQNLPFVYSKCTVQFKASNLEREKGEREGKTERSKNSDETIAHKGINEVHIKNTVFSLLIAGL